jgi:hypothetical protein
VPNSSHFFLHKYYFPYSFKQSFNLAPPCASSGVPLLVDDICAHLKPSLSLCASNSTTSLPLSIYLYLTPRAPLGMNRAIKPKRQQEVLDLPITNTEQNKNKSLEHQISFSERERERDKARLLHSLYKHHFLRSPESKHASLLVLQEAATMKLLDTKNSLRN